MIEYFNHPYLLELFITALVFTFVGRRQVKRNIKSIAAGLIGETVENTIDRLIEDGYIKTRLDKDGDIELVKYNEQV